MFPMLRGKEAQMFYRGSNHLPPLGGELLHLGVNVKRPLLLVRSQMFPGFHAVQHALLLFRRKRGKMPQALPQQLLLFRRQMAKCGIALQGPFLLPRWNILISAKPVAGMSRTWVRGVLILTSLVRRAHIILLRRA
jgi:hypothetical protein